MPMESSDGLGGIGDFDGQHDRLGCPRNSHLSGHVTVGHVPLEILKRDPSLIELRGLSFCARDEHRVLASQNQAAGQR